MSIELGHVAFTVKDMEASLKFYANALGIRKAFSLDREGQPWIEYLKVADGQFIELFYGGDGIPPSRTFSHLCLKVDDIHAAAEQIETAGYALDVSPRQGSDGNWQCWTKDPDGVRVEIMQIDPASPQAKA